MNVLSTSMLSLFGEMKLIFLENNTVDQGGHNTYVWCGVDTFQFLVVVPRYRK